jgi:hypothetical protein
MGIAAVLLTVAGIVALIWGAMQKFKAGRLAKAPFVKTGDAARQGEKVAGEKGAISVEGKVNAKSLLTSPVTKTQCLYYELEVVGKWKEGDSEKSKDYVKEKHAAPFALDDGTGAIRIEASEGGDFDCIEKTFEETKKEGFFADLKSAVGKGQPMMFGQYAFTNPPMSTADKFTCIERVVKPQPQLFILGKIENGAITAPKWTSLIMSNKTRDQLLGSTAKAAKNFLIGGAAAAGVGVILGVVSKLVG